jgi:hypothetical protein
MRYQPFMDALQAVIRLLSVRRGIFMALVGLLCSVCCSTVLVRPLINYQLDNEATLGGTVIIHPFFVGSGVTLISESYSYYDVVWDENAEWDYLNEKYVKGTYRGTGSTYTICV